MGKKIEVFFIRLTGRVKKTRFPLHVRSLRWHEVVAPEC